MPNAQLMPHPARRLIARGLGASSPTLTLAELAPLWQALPAGNDVVVKEGYYYAALVSVSTSVSDDTIRQEAIKRNLKILDWKEQGDGSFQPVDPNTSHRYVHLIAFATADGGAIPWKSPWPTTLFNVVKGWYVTPAGAANAPAPTQAPGTNWLGWGIALGATAIVATGGWLAWEHYHHKHHHT